jgi:hypothetical protein
VLHLLDRVVFFHKPTMIVPIVGANESASDPPEWAMLELNGELIAPAVLPDGQQNDENQNELLGPDRVELGSLRFAHEVGMMRTFCSMLLCVRMWCVHPILNSLFYSAKTGHANHGGGKPRTQGTNRHSQRILLRHEEAKTREQSCGIQSGWRGDKEAFVQSLSKEHCAIKRV